MRLTYNYSEFSSAQTIICSLIDDKELSLGVISLNENLIFLSILLYTERLLGDSCVRVF